MWCPVFLLFASSVFTFSATCSALLCSAALLDCGMVETEWRLNDASDLGKFYRASLQSHLNAETNS